MLIDKRIKYVERFKRQINHYHNGIKCNRSKEKIHFFIGEKCDLKVKFDHIPIGFKKPPTEKQKRLSERMKVIWSIKKGLSIREIHLKHNISIANITAICSTKQMYYNGLTEKLLLNTRNYDNRKW